MGKDLGRQRGANIRFSFDFQRALRRTSLNVTLIKNKGAKPQATHSCQMLGTVNERLLDIDNQTKQSDICDGVQDLSENCVT